MDRETELHLRLEGRSVPVRVRRAAAVESLHSGRELAELHVRASTADAETHRWLAAALRDLGDRSVQATDPAGEFAGRWLLSWNSYAEAAGVHTYTLILREVEELSLEALLLGDAELHPYEYREEAFGEGLVVWAKLVGQEDDVLRLRGLMRGRETISVVRRGIQDEPREMRPLVAEWSRFEDRTKYRLVLADREIDDEAHPELARIERQNNRAALGFYMNFAEQLVELLIRKDILSPAEVDAAREAATAAPVLVRHDFWHVADIDAL